ncbi:MAG: hypothetical protein HON98_13540 [Chloroflexi bacterium]|jgi:hypothetical protein|nr:hypothetical protein [Chloroflexota bacterium]MBT3669229.1 hypothetical protein [Chloroflexota bacterium]MBT4003178.1 hypothetical protein [Chloroflexota bacterium]MBT4306473.1 hypothetical protein [Chloroflexota bacterium]MBT4534973.1 hypothetical protein [Chloroflexota bacterium]
MRNESDLTKNIKKIFLSPLNSFGQWVIVVIVAVLFIFVPQWYPIDWELNTTGIWSRFPDTYDNPNHVYPPWSVILMLPYYWIRAEGARIFSVLVIGWLTHRNQWSLNHFLAIVLSPYFLITMSKSSIDIFVLLLPILIWEYSDGKKWQSVGWGTAMCFSLLKPQGMVFIWVYWIWSNRRRFRELIIPLGILALVTIPTSLIGSPPLFIQWLENILNPSAQNIYFWSNNNVSMTSHLGIIPGLLLISCLSLILFFLTHSGRIVWTANHFYASLLYLSFFLMPYTSQQSLSSAMAFVPSWASVILQTVILKTSSYLTDYVKYMPWLVLILSFVSLLFYQPHKHQIPPDLTDPEK